MTGVPLTVSVPDAAAVLGLSDDVVYRLLDEGLLPELPRWSRRRLIPRAAIEAIVDRVMDDFDVDACLSALPCSAAAAGPDPAAGPPSAAVRGLPGRLNDDGRSHGARRRSTRGNPLPA